MGIVTTGGGLTATEAMVVVVSLATGDGEDVTGASADDALTEGVMVTGAAADDALADAEIATGTVAEGVVVDATAKGSPANTPLVVEAWEADEESSVSGDANMGAARADERLRDVTLGETRARVVLLINCTVDDVGFFNGHLVIGWNGEGRNKRSERDGIRGGLRGAAAGGDSR